MADTIPPRFWLSITPADIPGLIAFWHFQHPGEAFPSTQGASYTLASQSGPLAVVNDDSAPLGGTALDLREGDWLSIARQGCPLLDIHGRDGMLTLVAWLKRQRTATPHCEFVAGQWNESNLGRQYGLFLNLNAWGGNDRICGHLSTVGGPSPGYKYCMDGAMGATEIACDAWRTVAMSYDGQAGFAWLDGLLDARPGLNPYPLAGGLHDGGPDGSDFTVGAVDRSGEIGNFFCGQLAGLAVYDRALTPSAIFALAQL
jgi:hypothetical protein